MSTELHAQLIQAAERIDAQRMAAKAALSELMHAASDNPILKYSLDGARYFCPETTHAATSALLTAVSTLCGTRTHAVDLGHEFPRQLDVNRSDGDSPTLIRDALVRALEAFPAEQLRELGRKQLRLKAWRGLWLRPGCHSSPRQERAGWVIRMCGGHDTYSREPRANAALHETLHRTIPSLLELLIDDPAEFDAELHDYQVVLNAWDRSGSPVGRKILEDYRRFGFRVFKEKAELILSHADAETLQVELADVMAREAA